MCTVSWLINTNGYEVFFNRDEQRSRPKALLPAYDKKTDSIMPVDPQGNGTWIAVGRSGLTVCLLNNYQAQSKVSSSAASSSFVSRGLLVSELIKYKNSEQVIQQLHGTSMSQYMPFLLCVFPENLKSGNEQLFIFSWDGNEFVQKNISQPLISSAVLLEEVQKKRTLLFQEMTQDEVNRNIHLSYHSSHQSEKGKFSVCMHREDARTQSISHIVVGNEIKFRYHDAPPCNDKKWEEVVMGF